MINVFTYSPATGRTVINGPYPDNQDISGVVNTKILQYARTRAGKKGRDSDVLFSFGVVPPLKKRNGSYRPAGVVIVKDRKVEVLTIDEYSGQLEELCNESIHSTFSSRHYPACQSTRF